MNKKTWTKLWGCLVKLWLLRGSDAFQWCIIYNSCCVVFSTTNGYFVVLESNETSSDHLGHVGKIFAVGLQRCVQKYPESNSWTCWRYLYLKSCPIRSRDTRFWILRFVKITSKKTHAKVEMLMQRSGRASGTTFHHPTIICHTPVPARKCP